MKSTDHKRWEEQRQLHAAMTALTGRQVREPGKNNLHGDAAVRKSPKVTHTPTILTSEMSNKVRIAHISTSTTYRRSICAKSAAMRWSTKAVAAFWPSGDNWLSEEQNPVDGMHQSSQIYPPNSASYCHSVMQGC